MIDKLFLSTGSMKAGTTWLYKMLSSHNELFFTPEKEIHFLSDYYRSTSYLGRDFRYNRALDRIREMDETHRSSPYTLTWYGNFASLEEHLTFDWYSSLFEYNKRNAWNCDFSNVSCLLDKNDWEDIKLNVRELKAIYTLRDPIERLWSHTKFHHQFINETVNFNDWNIDDFSNFLNQDHILQNIPYSTNIETMESVLSKKDFIFLKMEDIFKDPSKQLNIIESFLNIEERIYPENISSKKINSSSSVKMPEAFIEIASELVKSEVENLKEIGIFY